MGNTHFYFKILFREMIVGFSDVSSVNCWKGGNMPYDGIFVLSSEEGTDSKSKQRGVGLYFVEL